MTTRAAPPGTTPLRGLRTASRYILLCGGFFIVVACGLIVAEIVMRQIFGSSLGGVDELAGFALAVGTAWSFGAVLLDKAHVRIDTVYACFGEKGRALLDIVSLAGTVLFMATLLYFSTEVLATSIRFGASSQSSLAIPKSVPQAMWVAGLAWFLVVAVILLFHSLAALARGDWKQVGRLAGAPDIEAELSAELADTEHRNAGEKEALS